LREAYCATRKRGGAKSRAARSACNTQGRVAKPPPGPEPRTTGLWRAAGRDGPVVWGGWRAVENGGVRRECGGDAP